MEQFQRQKMDSSKMPPQVLEKWPSSLLTEGFVPFPKKLLRCLHRVFAATAEMQELAVVLAVADYKRPNLSRLPSLQYLAFLSGLSESEFEDALHRLAEKGYVEINGDSEELAVAVSG